VNAKPKIMVATTDVLGWKTYGARLREYVAQRDDFEAIFVSLRPSVLQRAVTVRVPFNGNKLIDPIDVYRWKVGRWWRRVGRGLGIDAVHVATQVCALAFAELYPKVRYSIAIDVTRRLSTRELGAPHFPARTIALEKQIYERADTIATFSDWCMASLRDDYGIAPGKMFRCLPSVSIRRLPTRREGDNLPRILFVGKDFRRKGGDRLLAWHQKYFAHRAQLHIVSAQAPSARGLRNVICYGRVDNDVLMSRVYPTATVFCLPTRADMSSWVIAEASALGVPSVSSRLAGISEICLHERTGLLLSPDCDDAFVDALDRLLTDRALRDRMGAEARQHAEANLNASVTYRKLFDHILSRI
jgi:glycosyltransferase involved in cell wall biosynthesis